MVGRIISSDASVLEGAAHLAAADPRMKHAIGIIGPIPLRLRPPGFATLLHAIVSQQISVAAAAGIWARLEAAGLTAPAAIRSASDEALAGAGLSRAKISYARALAAAPVDLAALSACPDAEVIENLIKIKGIGRWTAEIYAMFALGRADVLAAGDLALQEAARALYHLEARPMEAELRAMARLWSPWKSVAARILFAYYRHIKAREGVT